MHDLETIHSNQYPDPVHKAAASFEMVLRQKNKSACDLMLETKVLASYTDIDVNSI